MKIRVAGIDKSSLTDGIGLRYMIFVTGCPHQCQGCFNPETWDYNSGYEKDIYEILEEIRKDTLLEGVTLSGGDPFYLQMKPLIELAREVKWLGLDIWAYTGWRFEDLLERAKKDQDTKELLELVDILVDGPFIEEEKSLDLRFKGSQNQRIINLKERYIMDYLDAYFFDPEQAPEEHREKWISYYLDTFLERMKEQGYSLTRKMIDLETERLQKEYRKNFKSFSLDGYDYSIHPYLLRTRRKKEN